MEGRNEREMANLPSISFPWIASRDSHRLSDAFQRLSLVGQLKAENVILWLVVVIRFSARNSAKNREKSFSLDEIRMTRYLLRMLRLIFARLISKVANFKGVFAQ